MTLETLFCPFLALKQNKTDNLSLIELVQNFILHGAKGCKDLQVVSSPCSSLGLWGLKKHASLSIFFFCNIRTVYKCVLMGTLIPLFTMYLLFLDCYFQSFRVQTHIKPKGKQFHFFFGRHVPPVCCSVSSIIVQSF